MCNYNLSEFRLEDYVNVFWVASIMKISLVFLCLLKLQFLKFEDL